MDNWFLLVSVVLILVGLGLVYNKLTRVEALINELGSQIGAYVDAMETEKEGKKS